MNKYASNRYVNYEWWDETSQFDPKARWVGSCEYYERLYRCRVPRKMLQRAEQSGDFGELFDWIEANNEKGIWLK